MRRVYPDESEHQNPSVGTGFLHHTYEDGLIHLITNYHCLAGRDLKGNTIGSFIPNFIDIGVTFSEPAEERGYFYRRLGWLRYQLLDEEENPLFYHLPKDEKGNVEGDIAILPIKLDTSWLGNSGSHFNVSHQPFYSLHLDYDIEVGEDCFVIGYPHGLQGDGRTPIWKRATIASEPHITYQGNLVFLVDTATRKGMSGSPVVLSRREISVSDRSRTGIDEKRQEKLIGVYSGRLGDDELGVQLGMVWSIELVRLLVSQLPKTIAGLTPCGFTR